MRDYVKNLFLSAYCDGGKGGVFRMIGENYCAVRNQRKKELGGIDQ